MKRSRNWIIGIVLTTAAGIFALQNGLAPTSVSATVTSTSINGSPLSITEMPTLSPTYEGCSFNWANHDAPELTKKLDAMVRSLNLDARANVSLYGEDCVYGDGHSTFSTMETDFYIHLPVDDLRDEEVFGKWMAKVLPLIIKIPHEEIQGNYGFVEFWFEKTETKKVVVRVPIQQYIDKSQGMAGSELLHLFYTSP